MKLGIFDTSFLRKALLVFSIAVGLIIPGPGYSQERPIRFGIAEAGYPPYLMSADGGLRGIVGDTFMEIANAIGYQVEVVILPAKRLKRNMMRGEIDARAAALEWEGGIAGYVWTDGIIRVSDNVVMAADGMTNFASLDDLRGKTVVLRLGYTYPSLEEMIESGAINSSRTNRFENILKMVDRKRVDFGIADETVAKWVIRDQNLKFEPPQFFATPGFDEVGFRIILASEKWAPFVHEFNEALAKFKMSGGLQKILDKYR